MTPLPFSGLSLIVHLGIICGAWLFRLVGIRDNKGILKFSESWFVSKRLLSLMVLGSICTLMTMFIVVAITTGVREGATEWHRMQFTNAFTEIKETGSNLYPQFLEYHARYESKQVSITR